MLNLRTNPILAGPAEPNDPALPGRHVMRQRVTKREMRHQLEVANAARELDALPKRDEAIHCVMRGNFHGWDLVPAILALAAPETIEQIYIATLGFNKQNAAELLRMIDAGQIRQVVFLCSKYFQAACPAEYEMLSAGLASRGQKLLATRSHAKILAAKLTDGRHIVVESSANLRSCRNIEQFCMTESPQLWAFHRAWMEEIYAAAKDGPDSPPPPKRRKAA